VAGLLATAGTLRAQDRIPRIPSGVPLVVTPVQAILPTTSGGFPGGASSRSAALEAVNAEVDFAVSEEPRANKWASPSRVVRAADRNPMLDVDPRQLSSRGLTVDGGGRYLYEPLHGQLRSLAALLDARLIALPLVVWYRTAEEIEGEGEGSGGAEDAGPAGGTAAPGPDGDGAEAGDAPDAAEWTARGRAMMRVVLIDARAGKVLWKGEVGGDRAPADSPAALATLAARLVQMLSNS
jgi:hypothetical protein